MPRPGRTWIAWIPRAATFVALLSVAGSGGCDWFNEPIEANLAPETVMETCPEHVTAGDDVTIEWGGSDIDGTVVEYQWTYDDTISDATSQTSIVIEEVAESVHLFQVAAVDDDGEADPTPARCEFAASGVGGLVGRVVLAEFITGRGCPNCSNARDGLRIVLREYGADSLCVVSYHDIPHSLATAETDARIQWYTESPETPNMPIVIFDGDWVDHVEGAADSTSAAATYRGRIDEKREVGSPVTLELSGDAAAGDVTVKVKVREQLTGGPNVLRTVVVEDDVFADLEMHIFATRDILDEESLTVAAAGDSAVIERSFTVDPGWNTDNLDVIAFVQDDSTNEILQSSRLMLR